MWNLIFFSALTVFNVYILYVSGDQNCGQKVFVRNSAEDNLLFNNGLLLETTVSRRLECVSLARQQDDCNLILHNPSSAMCRLYHYNPANQTGTGVTATGWKNYARKCTGLQCIPDCNATESSVPCFCEHDWKETHASVFYKRCFTNTGGDTVMLNLNFDIEAGIDVILNGPVLDINNWIGAQFYNTHTDTIASFGIGVNRHDGSCRKHYLSINLECDDPMPEVDISWVSFTFRLTETTIEIFVDEQRVAECQYLYRGNKMSFYGIGDDAQVLFVHTPNQP